VPPQVARATGHGYVVRQHYGVEAMSLVGRMHGRAVLTRRVRVLSQQIAGLLPRNARVLDIGSGDGSIAALVQQARDDVLVTGIDVLVRPNTRIPVERFDGVTVPYDDRSFDAVMFVDVLHHADDPARLLAEGARVGANVVVKDHLANGAFARSTLRAMDWVGNASHGVSLPYNYLSTAQWQRVFKEQGLTVDTEITRLGLYPRPAAWMFERRLHALWRLRSTPLVRD
jgi:SAM-dependent methyltransferase